MLNNKDYCDYETCVTLRELGYNAPQRLIPDYFGVFEEPQYDENIHLYDAQKWLREEKKINVGVDWDDDENHWYLYIKKIGFPDWSGTSISHSCYSSYEEALSEGVLASIKILQDEQKENN